MTNKQNTFKRIEAMEHILISTVFNGHILAIREYKTGTRGQCLKAQRELQGESFVIRNTQRAIHNFKLKNSIGE